MHQVDHLNKTTSIERCKNHHYFIYTGQDKFHNFGRGQGEAKEATRRKLKKTNQNLYNLLEQIWPCNNPFVAICEDDAHGYTKGAAQKLIIGKSVEGKPYEMECLKDADTPELDVVQDLSPLPTKNVGTESKCLAVTQDGGWIGKYLVSFKRMVSGVVDQALGESNELAWWLRKCCAKYAKFE